MAIESLPSAAQKEINMRRAASHHTMDASFDFDCTRVGQLIGAATVRVRDKLRLEIQAHAF
jgi:hypothetical protein